MQKLGRSGDPCCIFLLSFTGPFLLGTCVLSEGHPTLDGLSPGERWDALHDASGANSKKF